MTTKFAVATALLTSMPGSPLTQSRYVPTPKDAQESYEDYEKRTWKERLHVNEGGNIILPPGMLKNNLIGGAKHLGEKIPGKGNKQYGGYFSKSVMVVDEADTGVPLDDVQCEWMHVPADGTPGGSKRVLKCFPSISKWQAIACYYVYDLTINLDVFRRTLEAAGMFVGVGAFRPEKRQHRGRFGVSKLVWQVYEGANIITTEGDVTLLDDINTELQSFADELQNA